MKQPLAIEYGQLYGSAPVSGEFAATAAAGGGVTSAAYAAIAQQHQQQQHQQQQVQHAQQGNVGMSGRLGNLTAEQASMLALQGGLGDYSSAEITEMIANVRREGISGPSHNGDGSGVGEENLAGGMLGHGGQSKRGGPGMALASGPAAVSQATDSDGSDGRPLKKRANR